MYIYMQQICLIMLPPLLPLQNSANERPFIYYHLYIVLTVLNRETKSRSCMR